MKKKTLDFFDNARDFLLNVFGTILAFFVLAGQFFKRTFLFFVSVAGDFWKWLTQDLLPFFKWMFGFFGVFFSWLSTDIFPFFKWMFGYVARFFKIIFWPFIKLYKFFKPYLLKVFGPAGRLFAKIFNPVLAAFGALWLKLKFKLGLAGTQPIENALIQLKQEIVFLDLFNILLNSVIGFFAGLAITIIFNFSWVYSFMPAFIVLIYFTIVYFRQKKLLIVENKVPELNERLRTAADNIKVNNDITNDLKADVVREMKKVKTTLFIDLEGVGVRVFSIAIIAFIIVILSFLDLTFDFQFSPVVQNPINYVRERVFTQAVALNASLAYSEGNMSNAYGNKTALIKLGDEQLSIEINPLQSELSFDEVSEAEMKNFNPPVYPKEIYTSYDASYTEKIAKKNQAVVKSYFEQISR